MSIGGVEQTVRGYTLHRRRLSALLYLATGAEERGRGREALETLEKLAGEEVDRETRKALLESRLPPDEDGR
ncbi:hypothetical protein Pyrfu_1909 [Pyrolobus fumarii 1A]|uniref:Uncharacterized protein n=1 Tax=Pyrolobus fumarii (strain DSM 11204 / 1A) TaxID=694429 RepID=G0ED84_PYRF1|nr:hypothetical protein [Pyrolobus fumarii]AEM39762.1 hypothetical protein Pyrfu_1909 [Pyrolobus fumarii 1A]